MFKKRIGITQKIMKHPRYDEVMDCLDVKWSEFLASLNILPVPLPLMSPNLVPEMWEKLQLDGLILSGGNSLVEFAAQRESKESLSLERDEYEKALLKEALSAQVPVLGVCRGLQLINIYFGGQLVEIEGHAGTRHVVFSENDFVCPAEINSFHGYAVPRQNLAKNLIPLAHDSADNIEAFRHAHKKVLAIMWHPERETSPNKIDCKLIKGHFEI